MSALWCSASSLSQQSDAKWSRHHLQNWCSGISPISSFQPHLSFWWWTCFYPESLFILSCWQPLMILVIKKGQCQQTQCFFAVLFLGRVWIFFCPLDNIVAATICVPLHGYQVRPRLRASPGCHLAKLALGVALFTPILPRIYPSSCTSHSMLDRRTGDPARFVCLSRHAYCVTSSNMWHWLCVNWLLLCAFF